MIKNLFSNLTTSNENLEKILLSIPFDEVSANKLIKHKNIDINKTNTDNDTILDICLRNNKFKASSWLVKKGILITNKNKDNISSVRLAIQKGDLAVIDSMLKHSKFNINQVDINGRSLLQDAVIHGNEKIARKLIKNSIDINIKDKYNRNVAFDAISYGEEKIVDEIISIDGLELNNKDINGKTILHSPIVLEDDNLAKKLLVYGANPTICDDEGFNFLTYTALRGEDGEELLDTAIHAGCDLNYKIANKNSVILEVLYAFSHVTDGERKRRSELKNVAKKLLLGGSDVNDVNKYGETILFEMVRKNDIEGCVFLLENKVDVNKVNKNFESALLVAVLKGIEYLDITILLLQAGADPTLRNRHSQSIPEVLNEIILHVHGHRLTPHNEILIHINPDGKYMLLLKEILLSKFDFDYLDSTGNPLFFMPFLFGDLKTTKLYFQSKINSNLKNKFGHNLFYEYVLKVFKQNEYFQEFRENLIFLLVNEVNTDSKNKHGQTVYAKIALIKNCNLKLFRKLIEVTRHNYKSIDFLGRTIIHSCVWSNNVELLNLVYGVGRNIQDIPDKLNILPITYAAILGNKIMVKEFLRRDALITSGKAISRNSKIRFQDMIKNLDTLTLDIEDPDYLRKIAILIEQVKKDFSLEPAQKIIR